MNRREKIITGILYVVFIVYILFLLKLLFFARMSFVENRLINLIPFDTVGRYIQYLISGSDNAKSFAFSNLVGNVVVFMPLGAYLLLFKKDKRVGMNLLFVFAASLLTEILQGVFGLGASDIDDIILNSAGGLIGILGYKLLAMVLRNEERLRVVAVVLSVLALPVLLYVLFGVRLKL